MAHLFFQVQGGAHRIIAPDALKEVGFSPPPEPKPETPGTDYIASDAPATPQETAA